MKLYYSFIIAFMLPFISTAQTKDTIILDGYISQNELKEYSWFQKNHKQYKPNKKAIKQLQDINSVNILVILGTWCSDSKEHVPAFLKVAEKAGISDIQLIAVNRKKASDAVDVSSFNVEYVPLIIVYRNGKEAGRIIETPKKFIEEDLLEILK